MADGTKIPRKYWWVIALVPVVVALVNIVPSLLRSGTDSAEVISVAGSQFNGSVGSVAFNTVSVVLEQVRQETGKEIAQADVTLIERAMKLVQDGQFNDAIPLLNDAAEKYPVTSLRANLGAAHAAAGDPAAAIKELATLPDSTARSNLKGLGPIEASNCPGISAQLTRFADSGGMITADVTFLWGEDNTLCAIEPAKSYIVDEKSGRKWNATLNGDSSGSVQLKKGLTFATWAKFRIEDARPDGFTLVFGSVAHPYENLKLR